MNKTAHTITPVYFPFTFIGNNLLQEVTTFWKEIAVYQPSGMMMPLSLQSWINQGLLKIRTPLGGAPDEKELRSALRSFQSWGEMHQKTDIAYLKAIDAASQGVDTMTSGIIADLKRYMKMNPEERSGNERFSSQLFLHLAQEHDQKSYEAIEEIRDYERSQNLLRKTLHFFSESDYLLEEFKYIDLPVVTKDKESATCSMVEQRIRAWNYLFQEDGSDTDFLFTDSREALWLLLGEDHEKYEVLQCRPFSPFPFYSLFFELMTEKWSDAMREKISEASRTSCMTEGQSHILLRCYLVPGQSPRDLLERVCSTEDNVLPGNEGGDAGKGNAILGLLEWVGL